MSDITLDIADFHWVTQILDTMDSGLIVLDQEYKVCVWNSFMQSYSGVLSQEILGECLFEHFEELPRTWLETKIKLPPIWKLVLFLAGKTDRTFLSSTIFLRFQTAVILCIKIS